MRLSLGFATHLINKSSIQIVVYDSAINAKVTVMEIDNHPDSPVVEIRAKILESPSRTPLVPGFTTELGKPLLVPIVTAAIAYEDEYTGSIHTLIIHNA